MKLYYAPAASSLAPHIALLEAGLKFSLVKVDLKTKLLSDGTDFKEINPLGYVPALQLKNGEVLTECTAILQYIADQSSARNLAPVNGSFARYKLQSLLNFIATELHKNFSPLFDPTSVDAAKQNAIHKLQQRFGAIETMLGKAAYLSGEQFTLADIYLFNVCLWARLVKFDLTPYPSLQTYLEQIAQRPAVKQALQEEGLLRHGE